jgi:hypothetical protein
LNRTDLRGDLFRRLRGLARQCLHLRSHNRKAPARFAGPCRFNRCIEGQQIDLFGNRADQLDDVADAVGAGRKFADQLIGALRDAGRAMHHVAGLRGLAGDLAHRGAEFVRRGRDAATLADVCSDDAVAACACVSASAAIPDSARAVSSMRAAFCVTVPIAVCAVARSVPINCSMAAVRWRCDSCSRCCWAEKHAVRFRPHRTLRANAPSPPISSRSATDATCTSVSPVDSRRMS